MFSKFEQNFNDEQNLKMAAGPSSKGAPASERLYAIVKPELLKWARETGGFTLEQAAKKLGLPNPERLTAFERGELKPTVRQLREASRVYKRPLSIFFLKKPPHTPQPLHDFRRLPGIDAPELSPELLLEMRRARRRQTIATELTSELGAKVQTFSISTSLSDNPEKAAEHVRLWLGVSLEEQRRWKGEYDALNGWINVLERHDILVFQTSEVVLEEMRGFSISGSTFPVIVLNSKDRPRARVFSLMHEFVHLTLNRGGVCFPSYGTGTRTRTQNERVESFCNKVAGEILVPTPALNFTLSSQPRFTNLKPPDQLIQYLAQEFAVSREVILLRLLALQLASASYVAEKFQQYKKQYAKLKQSQENLGFVPFYRLVVRDNGKRYIRLTLEALKQQQITHADISEYLGIKLKHLDIIEDEARIK